LVHSSLVESIDVSAILRDLWWVRVGHDLLVVDLFIISVLHLMVLIDLLVLFMMFLHVYLFIIMLFLLLLLLISQLHLLLWNIQVFTAL
jgi:hypothetical protein